MPTRSSSDALDRWLETRLLDVPTELAEAVRTLARTAPSLGEASLVWAALEGFESVARSARSRSRALELLAADALLTYAFEASADAKLGGSAARAIELADLTGPGGEIGRRLVAGAGCAR